MCISPIRIRNPNYGKNCDGNSPFRLKDCTSLMIDVPCGVCDECIARKQMDMCQRVQMESLSNHLFFCTLTYNDDRLPHLVTSTGHEIRFADYHDVQNMFKRIRNDNLLGRSFRWFAVSELGSKRGRPH